MHDEYNVKKLHFNSFNIVRKLLLYYNFGKVMDMLTNMTIENYRLLHIRRFLILLQQIINHYRKKMLQVTRY